VELLLHPPDRPEHHRPDRRGRLSTVGHAAAFRAFARAAKAAGIRFMVIGGTFRDIAMRAANMRDIDVLLVDDIKLSTAEMARAGFRPVAGSKHAWRYRVRGQPHVDLEVAALASSTEAAGPFSVAYQHSRSARIEGVTVRVPRIDDFVILKLLAASTEVRRRSHTPRDEIELAGTKGDFEALWAEVRGARTTHDRDRQRFGLVPRGSAHSSPPRGALLQCRSTRGFQRPRVLFHKSNRS
jgi:hypothetical protein